jgi:hypothetical protein
MMLRNAAGRFSTTCTGGLVTSFVAAAVLAGAAQTKAVPPVAPAALQKLLPTIDGWTGGVARADLVEISPDAKYSFASQTFTKDDQRVKLTLADTGFSTDSLAALATMVLSMPEDYSGDVGGLAIKRSLIGGSPAVEAWDAKKTAGEVTVVVGGRFVASLEASKIDSLATLRGMLDKIDLKALAALK